MEIMISVNRHKSETMKIKKGRPMVLVNVKIKEIY